jgi:arabinofuranosyltransferase
MKASGRLLLALLTIVFAVIVLRNAWIHDDAYITYRTVDNFVNGYGLRWNTAERVQTYTHPLWMFLVAAANFVTHEIYFTAIALSVALSVAAVLLVAVGVASSAAAGCLAIVILTFSKAFVDYSTSGLENPLTHALLGAFLAVYFRRKAGATTLYVLASLAALAAVNRADTVLLFVPALLVVLAQVGVSRGLVAISAGFVPLVLWEAFSVLYYGFPFPNTAYAKLFDTGVTTGERLRHGLYYLEDSARLDPLTLLTVGAAAAGAVWSRERRHLGVAVGIAAYLSYIVWIGGDFVTGRFMTGPVFAAAALVARWRPPSRMALAAAAMAAVVVGATASAPPPFSTSGVATRGRELMGPHGIADERPFYYPHSGFLLAVRRASPVATHPWAVEGIEARNKRTPIVVRGDVGYFGFYAGPAVHVVDVWGLGDPLLARLPARADVKWRIGHFTRAIPDGYLDTLASGRNSIRDRSVAALYDRLSLITRGRLLDPNRLTAIWKINVGN